MSKQLTPERLAELRRIAEAASKAEIELADVDLGGTISTLLDEIERLRRERAQAASLIRSAIDWIYDEETGEWAWDDSDYRHALEELRQAIDLLCPEKGGGDDE